MRRQQRRKTWLQCNLRGLQGLCANLQSAKQFLEILLEASMHRKPGQPRGAALTVLLRQCRRPLCLSKFVSWYHELMLKLSLFHCIFTFFSDVLLFPASEFLFNILCVSSSFLPSPSVMFPAVRQATRSHEWTRARSDSSRQSRQVFLATKCNIPLQEGQKHGSVKWNLVPKSQ